MPNASPRSPTRRRRWLLHSYRVGIFAFLLLLIHREHGQFAGSERGALKEEVGLEMVQPFFPEATRIGGWAESHGGQTLFDAEDNPVGHVLQTSPEADRVVGFSGPTNTLIAFDKSNRVRGLLVLRSDDTREHLRVVLEDGDFLAQWDGLRRAELEEPREFDAVSGATLTSMAIADGIVTRFGGNAETERFPEDIALAEVREFLGGAASLEPLPTRPALHKVLDGNGQLLGYVSRTSPFADHMIGYQGPTDLLLVLDPGERLLALAVRSSYDNEPFVGYLGEDEYFFNTFIGFDLRELAGIDMVDAGIAEVSGATKTSITAAEGLILAASELVREKEPAKSASWWNRSGLSLRDAGTASVVLAGVLIAFTRLRGKRWLRVAFQVVLVVYLGFVNADMLSQALLVGWARNGMAWTTAPGLVLLTVAALVAPIFTGRQIYCTHLCPFGAVQDWLGRKLPKQLSVKGLADRILSALPALLLAWVVVVAMGHLPFSLVGLEPFDAFVFRIAGWATIAVAGVGLVAAIFVPRAYCRYGCPTGAMLKFLRISAASERFGRRDWFAAGLALVALAMHAV